MVWVKGLHEVEVVQIHVHPFSDKGVVGKVPSKDRGAVLELQKPRHPLIAPRWAFLRFLQIWGEPRYYHYILGLGPLEKLGELGQGFLCGVDVKHDRINATFFCLVEVRLLHWGVPVTETKGEEGLAVQVQFVSPDLHLSGINRFTPRICVRPDFFKA